MYSYIFDFKGGTYVSQVNADLLSESLTEWFKKILTELNEIEGLNKNLIEEIKTQTEEDPPILLNGLTNAWFCHFLLNNEQSYLHIIKTDSRKNTDAKKSFVAKIFKIENGEKIEIKGIPEIFELIVNGRLTNISNYLNSVKKIDPDIYSKSIQHCIVELYHFIEWYLRLACFYIDSEYGLNPYKSPNLDMSKSILKKNGIIISEISEHQKIKRLEKICNDIKHGFDLTVNIKRTLQIKRTEQLDPSILENILLEGLNATKKYLSDISSTINLNATRANTAIKNKAPNE